MAKPITSGTKAGTTKGFLIETVAIKGVTRPMGADAGSHDKVTREDGSEDKASKAYTK